MNMILRELRENLVALIVWSFSLGAVVMIAFVEYEAYAGNPEMAALIDSFPPDIMAAFGFSGNNITTIPGFTAMFSVYFYLTLAIHAGLLGVGIIKKEEQDKTAEYLFTLPVERNRVLLNKLIASILNCLGFLVATILFTILGSLRYSPDADFYRFLGLLAIGLFMIQLIFLTIGMALSSVIKDVKLPSRIILGLVLGTWAISSVVSMVDEIDFLKYVTPFKYFEASIIAVDMTLDPVYFVLTFLIVSVSLFSLFTFYKKRDLYI